MFDSIAPYRPDTSSLFSQMIGSGVFPRTLLLTGDRCSGRLHLAMEVARVLSCRTDGNAYCDCHSCRDFTSYGMSNLVYVGNRDHLGRIEAALALCGELRTDSSRKLLIRTMRTMLLQFHQALIGGKEGKSSPNFDAASTMGELLIDLEHADGDAIPSLVQDIRGALKPMQVFLKRNSPLSIAQVRALQEWTVRTSFSDEPRFLVFEGVEESTEGARNSLLKLLEEPPSNTYVFIISEHPSRLLPTILSRLQRHHLAPLKKETVQRLLADEFSEYDGVYDTVEEFLLTKASVPCGTITEAALELVESLFNHVPVSNESLGRMCGELDDATSLEYFLKKFQMGINKRCTGGKCTVGTARIMMGIVDEGARKAFVFNQNGKLLVESLYYRLREVV